MLLCKITTSLERRKCSSRVRTIRRVRENVCEWKKVHYLSAYSSTILVAHNGCTTTRCCRAVLRGAGMNRRLVCRNLYFFKTITVAVTRYHRCAADDLRRPAKYSSFTISASFVHVASWAQKPPRYIFATFIFDGYNNNNIIAV